MNRTELNAQLWHTSSSPSHKGCEVSRTELGFDNLRATTARLVRPDRERFNAGVDGFTLLGLAGECDKPIEIGLSDFRSRMKIRH